MPKQDRQKIEYLDESGTLNPNASEVADELFIRNAFFDPRDLVQVKYEMLRRVSKENCSVKEAVNNFAMSRQNFYKVKNVFEQKGMTGLLPGKRGPKGGFKLTEDIIQFIKSMTQVDPTLTSPQIADKIESEFNLVIHPRTIGRLRGGQKKRRRKV